MSIIAIIDIFSFIAGLAGLFILVFCRKDSLNRDIRLLLIGLLLVTLVYIFFMIIEWLGISHSLESFENIIGAIIPMMWAFAVYSIIQQRINNDLTINKENLRITLNSIGDAVIVTDVYGRITRMNATAETLTAWKFTQAKGKKIEEVFNIVDPITRKKISSPVEKVMETGKTYKLNSQTLLIGKDRTEYHIADSAAPIYNADQKIFGVVLVFSDMTEIYNQGERLRESEERLNLAIDGTKAGLWDWYIRTGKVIFNNRWAEIVGYQLNELEPMGFNVWQQLSHPEDLIALDEMLEKHFHEITDHIECEIRLKHRKGFWVWCMARAMVVERDKQGNAVRMTGTIIDISNQKRVELELKTQMDENIALNEEYISQNEELTNNINRISKINKELQEAKQNAEESARLKSAFLSNMSHEIRTPMNGIIGFSELLKDSNLTDDKKKYYAGIVIDSSKQLLAIVNDILDLSLIETGQVSLFF
jgi:PAS domain S-box-containing protein